MKGMGKRIFGLCADTFGLNKRMQGPQALVLRLHRILPECVLDRLRFQRQHALSEDGFDHLLTMLKRKYTLIHLDDYLAFEPHAIPRGERFACLTFDDGWQDNFVCGFPLLKAHNAPASIFLTEGYVGTNKPFWWQTLGDAFLDSLQNPEKETSLRAHIAVVDPEAPAFADIDSFMTWAHSLHESERLALARAIKPLSNGVPNRSLHWEQIRTMSLSGLVRFGVQPWTHMPMTQQREEVVQQEIARSYVLFEGQDDVAFNRFFCYPQGHTNEQILRWVADAGFQGGVTHFPSYASRHERERYRLPRLNVTEALARDPALFNYRLLKAGTQRGRQLLSNWVPPPGHAT